MFPSGPSDLGRKRSLSGNLDEMVYSPESRESTEEGDEGHERDGKHAEGDLGDDAHVGTWCP